MRDKSKKKKHGCIYYIFVVLCLSVIVLSISSNSTQNNPSEKTENNDSLAEVVQEIETPSPSNSPEPATEEEWIDYVARSIYGEDLISVELVDTDKNSPMIRVFCVFEDNLAVGLRRDMFMFNAKDFMKSIVQLSNEGKIAYESIDIHGRTTFLDKYGNESEGDAMSIRIYASELQKVNWENIKIDMLPDIAVSFAVHPLFRD